MPFILPTFNLTCDIYTGPWAGFGAPRLAGVPCQLRAPNMNAYTLTNGLFAVTQSIQLLLPPGTDIRDQYSAPTNRTDFVELIPGSTMLYQVMFVNDVGKGFPNEHRYATLAKSNAAGGWPVPIP